MAHENLKGFKEPKHIVELRRKQAEDRKKQYEKHNPESEETVEEQPTEEIVEEQPTEE